MFLRPMGLPDAILLRRVSAIHRPVWVLKAWLMGRHHNPPDAIHVGLNNHPRPVSRPGSAPCHKVGAIMTSKCVVEKWERERQNEE